MRKLITFLLLLTAVALQAAPQDKADEYFKKANEYFDKKDYKNAIVYLDSTIIANPEHTEAYAFRGVCKYELKKYRAAIEDFDLALIVVPGYAEVYFYRGLSHKELGEDKKACDDWVKAYNLGMKKAMKFIMKNCKLDEEKTKSK
jgi:tetratricopeptide (TPR) repeat protein